MLKMSVESTVVFPCCGDDMGYGVKYPLQLICGGFWWLGKHTTAVYVCVGASTCVGRRQG